MVFWVKETPEISLNHRRLLGEADRLEELGRRLQTAGGEEIQDGADAVRKNWEGESGENFAQKGRRCGQMTAQRGRELVRMAALVRKAADRMYQAERFSAEIAERRMYRG